MTSTKDVEAAVAEVTKGLDAGVVGLLPYATAIRKILASLAEQAADLAEYRRGEAEAERTIRSLQDENAALVERAFRLENKRRLRVREITMQDVRLGVGEGPLSASEVLAGVNAELRRRARLQDREGGVS